MDRIKRSDWLCENCDLIIFARRDECFKCRAPRPSGTSMGEPLNEDRGRKKYKYEPRPGDWICKSCHDIQFARNTVCRKCDTPKI
ncbi:MAG: putative RNA-binding protein C17H9.04c [Hyperionvirus sp.]|uniref:Putative RNA-binding protein C17H9.04c n=1 Tax=Hyperionvirus sp. TaxID=2487770 RepID=A0A3G5A8R3_9VIRU|nr:MAG: putative RNA-binding protein C17H9.04c [Hyperionvirus sp.]